ncbi:MAG: ATP-grasp domain-containing protein [Gammaproteobacteria bacterium]
MASNVPTAPDAAQRPRLLLVAPPTSYRIVPYLEAAHRLGIDLVVASQGEHSLIGAVARGLHVDLQQPERALAHIVTALRGETLAGVVGTDDATVELASRVGLALGLPHNPPEAALLARRKDLARTRLRQAGVPVPDHRRIDLELPLESQLRAFPFPVVVKPLMLSGSRGVVRADDLPALRGACQRIRGILDREALADPMERRHLLVERYLSGTEVALEGMLRDGRLEVLALFDKPDPLEGPYFEETYYITPSRLPAAFQRRIGERAAQASAAYGLREGPVHAELRLHDGDAWILEVAARTIGGQCARLLRFGTGVGLEELVLAQAVGRPLPHRSEDGAAGVMMIPIPEAGVLRRVEGVLAAQRVPYIDEVEISVREGYELVPLPEGSSYLGFLFAHGPDPAAVECALRRAHGCLRVVTAPLWKIGAH